MLFLSLDLCTLFMSGHWELHVKISVKELMCKKVQSSDVSQGLTSSVEKVVFVLKSLVILFCVKRWRPKACIKRDVAFASSLYISLPRFFIST